MSSADAIAIKTEEDNERKSLTLADKISLFADARILTIVDVRDTERFQKLLAMLTDS